MGGIKDAGHKLSRQDRRVTDTNEKIDAAVIALASEHLDEFPFSAREVVRQMGKRDSHAIVTRQRGGLKNYILEERQDLVDALVSLVADEQHNRGKISATFCQSFGLLLVEYRMLFSLDVVNHSYRNTEYVIEVLMSLVHEKRLLSFGAEFYLLLQAWHREQFARELVWTKYGRRLQDLLHRYQIARPSGGLPSETKTLTLPANGSIFYDELVDKRGED